MNRLTEFLNEINYKPSRQLKAMLHLFDDPPQPEAKPVVWTDLMAITASTTIYQPNEIVMKPPWWTGEDH